jgi:UDP-glucuronate 4-epimerase
MTKILVTGGAGFIGSHTTQALLDRGDEVVCLDNFNDYYSPARKYANVAPFLDRSGYTLIEGDVRDRDTLETLVSAHKPERIAHIAAMAGVRYSLQHPDLYEEVNVRGTLNVLEVARQHEIKDIVFASTSSIYGSRQKVPFSEDDRVDWPVSPYAATKRACELMGYTYHHLYDINFTALRFFTVYGPRGRPDMAAWLFTEAVFRGTALKMFGDGSSSRDYTYIDDIVQGVLAAIDKPMGYEIINLGNNHTIYLRDFVDMVQEFVGTAANIVHRPMPPGDVPRTCADISKAQRLLGYDPRTPFVEGLKKFVDWYRSEVAER